jgi:aminomethyltransferase
LEKHIPGVRQLPYLGHMGTMLFGKPITLSRTGYTGERGYEIFCRGQDAPMIWDRILDEGKSMGIIPCRFTTLDMLRAESYLLFFPFDNSEMYPFENEGPGDTLWELGLDFTVSPGQDGFPWRRRALPPAGQRTLQNLGPEASRERTSPAMARPLMQGGKKVGVVTQAMYSPLNNHNVAIARMPVDCANNGTEVEVNCGTHGPIKAVTHALPFYDVEKKRRSAQGLIGWAKDSPWLRFVAKGTDHSGP